MNATTTPRTKLLGIAAIVAPLLLLASTAAAVRGNGLGDDMVGGIIQIYAMAMFMLAAIGLTRAIEDRLPRLAALLTLVAALGVAGGVGYGVLGVYIDLGAVDINEMGEGVLTLQGPGALFPLAFAGIGFAFLRLAAEPRWCGVALIAGGLLFPVTRIGSIDALAPLADVLLIVGLAPLGWQLVQGRLRAGASDVAMGGTTTQPAT